MTKTNKHPAAPPESGRAQRPRHDSIERVMGEVGDRWTILILRKAFFGVRRFDGFQRNLSASPNILADRLRKLVANGLLVKRPYQDRPRRCEYRLTDKGLALYPAIVLLMRWGDQWLDAGRGPPLRLRHRACGHTCSPLLVCDRCGQPVTAREMDWQPGPGA